MYGRGFGDGEKGKWPAAAIPFGQPAVAANIPAGQVEQSVAWACLPGESVANHHGRLKTPATKNAVCEESSIPPSPPTPAIPCVYHGPSLTLGGVVGLLKSGSLSPGAQKEPGVYFALGDRLSRFSSEGSERCSRDGALPFPHVVRLKAAPACLFASRKSCSTGEPAIHFPFGRQHSPHRRDETVRDALGLPDDGVSLLLPRTRRRSAASPGERVGVE